MNTRRIFNAEVIKYAASDFLPHLKSMNIGVIDGMVSEENRIYDPTANPADLEIASIKNCFDRLGLSYGIVNPNKDGWVEDIMKYNPLLINVYGEYGEDGRMQGLLDLLGKHYVGSGVASSAISLSKPLFKCFAKQLGFDTPAFHYSHWDSKDAVKEIEDMQFPILAKVINGGCSIGMVKLDTHSDYLNFFNANKDILHRYFFEEFIEGRFITVGVLALDQRNFVFPPLEIITKSGMYDEAAKKDHNELGLAVYTFPLDDICKDGGVLQEIASEIFQAAAIKHFARIDFIVDRNGKAWVLEINTLPGISGTGNYMSAGSKAGLTYDEIMVTLLRGAVQSSGPEERSERNRYIEGNFGRPTYPNI